jgi:DNA-binding protein H-NS
MDDIEDLLAQRAALDQKIEEARRQQKSEAIAQVKALMAEHGLTLADLGTRSAAAPRKTARKVPPKYRHPDTGESWSGRGLQPNWLKAALAAGAQLSDFKV